MPAGTQEARILFATEPSAIQERGIHAINSSTAQLYAYLTFGRRLQLLLSRSSLIRHTPCSRSGVSRFLISIPLLLPMPCFRIQLLRFVRVTPLRGFSHPCDLVPQDHASCNSAKEVLEDGFSTSVWAINSDLESTIMLNNTCSVGVIDSI